MRGHGRARSSASLQQGAALPAPGVGSASAPSAKPTPHRLLRPSGKSDAIGAALRVSSAIIYSLSRALRLQTSLPREGFLATAAEVFHSACFCIVFNCLFESQLKTNLIQGFFSLHKGRLQKHRRKGGVKINSEELIRVLTVALIDSQHSPAMAFTHNSNPRPPYY